MWIQEGICSFGDALYIRDMEGEESYLRRMAGVARQTNNQIPIVQGEEIDSDQSYHGDIYGKGAFFMHSLRYVMGDELFFPTLKKLATDPQYTYDNAITTDDVEKLFSQAYGKSMKPFFDLFLRTPNKLEIGVKQTDADKFTIQLTNLNMDIPMEVVTDAGSQQMMIGKSPVTISSKTMPVIDPKVYYIKKIIIE